MRRRLSALLVVMTLVLAFGSNNGTRAQEAAASDPFDSTLARATEAIDSGKASTSALNQLRQDLNDLRKQASDVVDTGSVDARAIEAQLVALGSVPKDGESEADEIADRRTELNKNLAEANRPIREAQERLNQVELLIRELDQLIRLKDTRRLIERFPSIFWQGTLAKAKSELEGLGSETFSDASQRFQSEDFRENSFGLAVVSVGLAIIGLLLLLLVRPNLVRFFDKRFEETQTARRYVWALLSNLSNLIVPLLGAIALAVIVPALGIQSRLTDFVGQFVFYVLLVLIVANWLGHTVFSPLSPSRRLVRLDDQQAFHGLRLCQALGAVEAIELFVEALATGMIREQATISVLAAPVIIAAAVLLWRIAKLLNSVLSNHVADQKHPVDGDEPTETRKGLLKMLIFLMRATALLSVPLVLIGYVPMARHISDATGMTAGLLGFGLFIYTLIMGGVRAFFKRGVLKKEEASLPLLPFIVGTLLALAMLPALAIFWGARTSDVAEAWRLVTVGVQVGEVQLSLGVVVSLLVVFFLGSVFTRWLQHGLRETVLPRTKLDAGARNALVTGIGYAGLTLSALIAVSAAGLSLSSLAVVAGALSLGIGFGMQTIVSNFVSGIILLIERPIAEGDWIEVSGHAGIVKKIAVRSTQISTFDKHDVIVPNQDLIGGTVKNMTLSSRMGRLIIPVGIAYGSDLEKTKTILAQAAEDNESLLKEPAPAVLFRGLGDSSLDFELRCYLRNVDTMLSTQSDLLFRIYVDLSKAGIEIPFPQRDVHVRDIPSSGGSTRPAPKGDADDTELPD